jgi:hypothetical protein
MIYCFPHEAALLPRTKLSYVNLPGILSDGKRDRAARVAGYLSIQLGEQCFLIFVRGGEAFHAARFHPESRSPAALAEVLRIAATECERGEAGQIGYFTTTEPQLAAMLATIVNPPEDWGAPVDPGRPEMLFPRLRERGFTGVLELCDGGTFHYIEFAAGSYRAGYFSGRDATVPVPEFIRGIFDAAGRGLGARIFAPLEALPVLAAPGLVDLYRRVVGGVFIELTEAAGGDTAAALLRRSQEIAGADHPHLAAFHLPPEGGVAGDPVASPEVLTAAVAAWLTEVLIVAADDHGMDPATVVERVARDSRYVLQENRFFQLLPWAVTV